VPTLNKRQPEPEADQSKWFIVTAGPNHPFTFQLEPEGYKWLLAAGLSNESDIDWDVFGTLRSLDLLYTLNSSYTPSDAPVPDDLSFEEISDKERIRLAEGLLDKFSAAELSSKEGTLRFLLSIGDLAWELQEPIMETILSATPFDPSIVSDYTEAFSSHGHGFHTLSLEYNPILLALMLGVAYDVIEPMDDVETINEGDPVWVYDDWIVCAGTELIFYAVSSTVTNALPDLLRAEISEIAESVTIEDHFYSFFEQEFAAFSEFQFISLVQDRNPRLGRIIADGLETNYRNSILILPGGDLESDGPFETNNGPIL